MCRKTQRRRKPNANVSKDTEAEEPHVNVSNPTPNPTTTCRTTRRVREPNDYVSNDMEAKGTQRQRVERHGGEGNPTTCRTTWRRREPSANASKNAEAKATQCRPVERHDSATVRDVYWSSAVWRCSRCFLIYYFVKYT